jgi:hypothetical protein
MGGRRRVATAGEAGFSRGWRGAQFPHGSCRGKQTNASNHIGRIYRRASCGRWYRLEIKIVGDTPALPNSAISWWRRLRGWACEIRTQKCRQKLSV